MDPASRDETRFLIDIDYGEDNEGEIRFQLDNFKVPILLIYPTKNGRHYVTKPLNPAMLPIAEIKKDGLLLRSF